MSVTMSDIAARTGTSIAAVSVALNGAKSKTLRISDETRERILKAAEELGYRRNPLAGALATGRTNVIGFLMPPTSYFAEQDPFFSTMSNGITAGASKQGYNVMLLSGLDHLPGDEALKLIDRRIDGLITGGSEGIEAICCECERQGIAVVTIMGKNGPGRWNVECDDEAGARLATKHLIDFGHTRIAHLAGRKSVATSEPRRTAYVRTLIEAGLDVDPELILPGDFSRAGGYASTKKLMEMEPGRRPTAIFAGNDLSAHGAIDAIHDCGLDVPGDVAVVGFDDTWYATITRPALTSVHVDVFGIGATAVNQMVGLLAGEYPPEGRVVLPVSLTIRESCGFTKIFGDS